MVVRGKEKLAVFRSNAGEGRRTACPTEESEGPPKGGDKKIKKSSSSVFSELRRRAGRDEKAPMLL
jgi:hypothetical protein